MLSPATSCHCSLPLPHRPTHSQRQYLLSWQSSKPSDGEAPQQSTGPVQFQHVPDRHLEVLQFLHHPPPKTTPRHSTNSGTALTARALRLVLHHRIRRCGYSTKLYNTHSLRIGAATAARSGLPPATIKNLGRWRSEAYKVYTRHPLTQPSDSAVIASAQ